MTATPPQNCIAAGAQSNQYGIVLPRRPSLVLPSALLALCLCGGARAGTFAAPTGMPQTAAPASPIPPPEARIDINHAGIDGLMKVPGMTQTWAARIVRFRPYRTKQDLLDRGVLPSDVYDRIKNYIIAHRDKQ